MKIIMLFPGYGSQYIGMGKEFYDQSRIMQEYFEEAAICLPINFTKLIFSSSDNDLKILSNAYPAQFLVSICLFKILEQEGIIPTHVAGMDIGAYAALFAARGISFPDALYLLSKLALSQTTSEAAEQSLATPSFAMYLQKVDFKDLAIPLIDSTKNQMITTANQAHQLIVDGEAMPSSLNHIIDTLAEADLIIQVGPGTDLVPKLQKKYPSKTILSCNQPADLEKIKTIIEKL